ncbi:unnamed protein product [Staurois parvus]|uniref:Uncharacterized protein n=1 Tax=Staurois parvus TaxID=386267 RepID=A0ABN9E8U5_9NEOB|nr:unnamed protein product [Staurois parvus]
MKCPCYLFIGFFGCALSLGKDTGAPWSPIAWGPGVSRGPDEMPLVPFIGFFGCGLSVDKDTGAP